MKKLTVVNSLLTLGLVASIGLNAYEFTQVSSSRKDLVQINTRLDKTKKAINAKKNNPNQLANNINRDLKSMASLLKSYSSESQYNTNKKTIKKYMSEDLYKEAADRLFDKNKDYFDARKETSAINNTQVFINDPNQLKEDNKGIVSGNMWVEYSVSYSNMSGKGGMWYSFEYDTQTNKIVKFDVVYAVNDLGEQEQNNR